MSLEMELKARAEKEDCKKRMETVAGAGTAFVKDDTYWFPGVPGAGAFDLPHSGLRVRREKKAGNERALVTWKKKEKRNGMEVNDEKEFAVSDGTLFEELLYSLGLRKKTVKHKEGWVWEIDGITAELAEVSGITGGKSGTADTTLKTLGWFLELEIITENDEPETKARLLSLLEKTGIHRDRIESRYYTELLAD